jgi:hypothetical protein
MYFSYGHLFVPNETDFCIFMKHMKLRGLFGMLWNNRIIKYISLKYIILDIFYSPQPMYEFCFDNSVLCRATWYHS